MQYLPNFKTACISFAALFGGGKAYMDLGIEITDCGVCRIRLKTPMVLHADGEYCADVTEAEFLCLPKKLRVLV